MNRAVFFDRDGTLIYDKVYLNDPKLVEFIPGAVECLKDLKSKGYLLIVVTNQSGIARGLVTEENLHKIHQRMQEVLAQSGVQIDDFFFSPHSADSDHPSRKPNPGMLEMAIQKYSVERSHSWMIGDRMIDVEAGNRAGVRTILVSDKEDPKNFPYKAPTHICPIQKVPAYL